MISFKEYSFTNNNAPRDIFIRINDTFNPSVTQNIFKNSVKKKLLQLEIRIVIP